MKQEGTIAEYPQNFLELAAPLEDLLDEVALGKFITGLKVDIRAEVRVVEPTHLGWAMDLA